ncbi:MAG TPA: hypothetical protein DFR83_10490 [Deltaproteobacteria bacterium]|nr:hypothetical protein [Deltaproteobacteria bacterium]
MLLERGLGGVAAQPRHELGGIHVEEELHKVVIVDRCEHAPWGVAPVCKLVLYDDDASGHIAEVHPGHPHLVVSGGAQGVVATAGEGRPYPSGDTQTPTPLKAWKPSC